MVTLYNQFLNDVKPDEMPSPKERRLLRGLVVTPLFQTCNYQDVRTFYKKLPQEG